MKPDEYQTIACPAEGIYKEKGSRFLAFAYPVWSTDEAMQIVRSKQKEYHDARHHCYAWSIGEPDKLNTRMADDGEPSGTAGRPIFGQITSAGLNNILIVVVRYFGGIKLGTGGLCVAYKTAAADALASAHIVCRTYDSALTVFFAYSAMNDVMRVVKSFPDVTITAQNFEEQCSLSLRIRKGGEQSLRQKLSNIETLTIEP